MLKKQLNLALAVVLASSVAFGQADVRVESALNQTQMEVVKVLIFTSNLKARIPEIAQVNADVAGRYNSIRNTYFGSIPGSAVGAGAIYVGKESSEKLESLFKPLEPLFRASGRVIEATMDGIERVSRALGIDESSTFVSNRLERSVELTVELARSLVFKGSKESSSFIGLAGLLGTSIYLASHNAEEVVSTAAGRRILGYEASVAKALNDNINTLAEAFGLGGADSEKFKTALVNKVADQAIKNNFSKDMSKYDVDVLDLLVENKLASQDAADLVRALSDTYKVASKSGERIKADEAELLKTNIEFLAMMTAYLQEISASGAIQDESVRVEIDRLIGSISSKVRLIGGQVGTY